MTKRVIIIGAGIGGLTTAALLARAGLDVTVLEAHVYPGGCAGTFYHQGYRFDAGATLAAGFDPGGGMTRLGEALGIPWPVEPAHVAMRVHLPDGRQVTRWVDPEAWQAERLRAFGPAAEPFWRWQEATADRMWAVALAGVPWPPQTATDLARLTGVGLGMAAAAPLALPGLALDGLRPVAARLNGASAPLRQYVDGQLLIAAQATSKQANALYGASALDMPRRGVVHVRGGIGKIAEKLAQAVQCHGGQVRYRQRVTRVARQADGRYRVETNKGASFEADVVIFNLPPHDAAALMGADAPPKLRAAQLPADGWGAFTVYVGLDGAGLPAGLPLHHQVLAREPLGEGNSVFLSLSLPDDVGRAPAGQRALTISTHTALRPWWDLFERDRAAYEARKIEYTERVLAAGEIALPGLRAAAKLILPGTPVSFQRFTHRSYGWVGGLPQTNLFRAWGPRLGRNLWLVGDSIFPGQSVLATALGGSRVAEAIIKEES
ncbi:MAG: phytoene desaturase family protein [Anaerolineae bacterium]